MAGRVVEFADFLLNVLRIELRDQGKAQKVAVHTSCSARREMNTHVHGWALVDQLAQVERVVHDHESGMLWFWRGVFAAPPGYFRAMVSDKERGAARQRRGGVRHRRRRLFIEYQRQAGPRWQSLRGKHLASFLPGTHRARHDARDRILGKRCAPPPGANPSRARHGRLLRPPHPATRAAGATGAL